MSECAKCNGWGVDDVTGFACPSCQTVKQTLTVEVAEYVPRGGDHVMIWVNQRRTDLGGYSIESVPRHIAPKLVAAMQADAAPVETYRHKKRGTLYTVIGEAELQDATGLLCDGAEMVIYRGENGQTWVRHKDEFHDGRFEAVADRVSTSSPVDVSRSENTSDTLAALQFAADKLAGYACHDDDCEIMKHGVWTDSIPCTCGYTDAWRAYVAAKQASK